MCDPRSFLLMLLLSSSVKLLSSQEVITDEVFTGPTPSSSREPTSQSGDLTSVSGWAKESPGYIFSGENTRPEKSNLASSVDVTTAIELDNTNAATAMSFTAHTATLFHTSMAPEPDNKGTTATRAISMATSVAGTTVMLTLEPPSVSPASDTVTMAEISTAEMSTPTATAAGSTTKPYETTHDVADSELTTLSQQVSSGETSDALGSTTGSIHSSSKPLIPASTTLDRTPSPLIPASTTLDRTPSPLIPASTTLDMIPSPQTSALTAPPTSALRTVAVTPSERVSAPLSPTVKTTPSNMPLTTGPEGTTHKQTESVHPTTDTRETTFTASDTIPGLNVQSDRKENDKNVSPSWLIIAVIIGSIFFVAVLCIVTVFVKHRKKRSTELGYVNGWSQKSKKKKGVDDGAWAGPVKLEGREKVECEGLEEEPGHEAGKIVDVMDEMLSTFVALEENGVGRKGSKEAQKWEEQEPLLYIDEDMKQEGMEREGEREVEPKDKGGRLGNTETRKTELNGETFCLTTAV